MEYKYLKILFGLLILDFFLNLFFYSEYLFILFAIILFMISINLNSIFILRLKKSKFYKIFLIILINIIAFGISLFYFKFYPKDDFVIEFIMFVVLLFIFKISLIIQGFKFYFISKGLKIDYNAPTLKFYVVIILIVIIFIIIIIPEIMDSIISLAQIYSH